MRLANCID